MTDGWDALDHELGLWAMAGTPVRFWWRDDDAVAPTPALDALIDLADRHRAPAHLAVVPRDTGAPLVERLAHARRVWVMQHGYCHKNHEPAGQPASEIGQSRALDAQKVDLCRGRDRLAALGFARALPALAPPWNRIGPRTAEILPSLGFRLLSTFGPHDARLPEVAGLARVNCHLDPLRWRNGPEFRGTQKILNHLVQMLADRRSRGVPPDAPFGILSHHLDTTEETWAFLDRLFGVITAHEGSVWIGLHALIAQEAAHG